ncbi:MAG: winged helix-turn-helix domain-containing protein, partial [Caulobacteraceae bacterium]
MRGGEPVRLGSRARQILTILVARAGEVVPRNEIVASVWPHTTVVDNNLTVNIAALRQALGDGQDGAQYIVNVPGRGYRFVAPIEHDHGTD